MCCSHDPFSGKAYRKAQIELKPNKTYYDVDSNVNLTCEADVNTDLYKIIWYKRDLQGKLSKLKSALNASGILTLILNSLTAQDSGTYKCEISRPEVNYYNSQLVNITVKGTTLLIRVGIFWHNDVYLVVQEVERRHFPAVYRQVLGIV